MKTPQILAPAGGMDNLLSAVSAGANAVYMGWGELNARRGAKNFTREEFLQGASYCKARGVEVYMVINTLVYDRELPLVLQALALACEAQVSGIIVQDMGVAAIAKQLCPTLPLHGSTQMVIHSLSGALALKELGFSCAVLAREMSREEIELVTERGGIPTEVFVHGALCMSVSGQCYMSSMIGERSGNRGLCAQTCRLPFSAKGSKDDYALSLKDNCLIPHLGQLAAMGVSVLKIEGRMKRPEYVSAAVTACRNSLAGTAVDYTGLQSMFSRSGFTDGYYKSRRDAAMFGTRGKDDVAASATAISQSGSSDREFPGVPLIFTFTLRKDTPAALTVSDGVNTVTVEGDVPETALNKPTTHEMVQSSLAKLGGTFYIMDNVSFDMDDGLILPVSRINVLRRTALEQLTELRSRLVPIPFQSEDTPAPASLRNRTGKPMVRCVCTTADQITPLVKENSSLIYLPLEQATEADVSDIAHKLVVMLPHVCFGNDVGKLTPKLTAAKEKGITRLSSCHIGGLYLGKSLGFELFGEYGLNITNSFALKAYEDFGLADATLSFELNLPRAKAISGSIPMGIVAYGSLPLMTVRNCPMGGNCAKCTLTLTDRKNARFPVLCSSDYKEVLNSAPLYLADKQDDLQGFDFITLMFTNEPAAKCDDVLREYISGEGSREGITRGLYYRNVN